MELQDIVRRLRMGQSIKAIKRETGKHRRVIRRLLLLAEQEGWLDEQDEVPSEQQLQEVALLIGGTTRYRPISHGRVRSIVQGSPRGWRGPRAWYAGSSPRRGVGCQSRP